MNFVRVSLTLADIECLDFSYFPEINKGFILLRGSQGINITVTLYGNSENIDLNQSELKINGLRYRPGKIFKKYDQRLFLNYDEKGIALVHNIYSSTEIIYELFKVTKQGLRICDFVILKDGLKRHKLVISLYSGKIIVFDIGSQPPFSGTRENSYMYNMEPGETAIALSLDSSSRFLTVSTMREGLLLGRLIILELLFEDKIRFAFVDYQNLNCSHRNNVNSYIQCLVSDFNHLGMPLLISLQVSANMCLFSHYLKKAKKGTFLVQFEEPLQLQAQEIVQKVTVIEDRLLLFDGSSNMIIIDLIFS